ncbi:flp pilus-assembly TadE/G-like family protein [Mycobacterium sp. CBMA293]|uniref:Rv3654c family TadE-like protein n=1 Tax=unclassified Mycolicibacterium TaxID=2636767 RepID=UPI0012DC73CF|nr:MULTISPECIES: Rv3654c family TadE-like protein [unclassified Mycolicibacterium]MUL46060.1 flp pilus-assembly TadE/G-like family protein [Mycolicibacterium sp. CBMA 360]MUL58893.1 flp pilus-assembly TadE/G-like family protein [Mycolicibacterium sp. CBMA 335]MUL69287.1 flp pilus-assembly TadE/G-like family protein [Mycolicibacterium sp. CBMA 311]MUL94251.1 flp pilus-assembly TadE/G-like family protein [Mycolicibacterium sp. CBMA 230]MUM05266.1 helicase [Mycolicibacterium sp. CBMA 213]
MNQVRDDSGSATVLAVALIVVLIGLMTGAAAVGAAVIGRHRAQSAADLAALAAAGALALGPDQSCSRAAAVAEDMGSRVGRCSVQRLDVVVDVEVTVRFGRWNLGVAHGRARAGPG